MKLGTKPENIIFANSVKKETDLKFAYENKIRMTTADTIEELEKIKRIAPEMNILWRVSIKENKSEQLATIFSNKFGDDFDSI